MAAAAARISGRLSTPVTRHARPVAVGMVEQRERDVRAAGPDVEDVQRRAGRRRAPRWRAMDSRTPPSRRFTRARSRRLPRSDRRVVQRSVEQLVPVGHPAHRARVGVAAASRPAGADGPTAAHDPHRRRRRGPHRPGDPRRTARSSRRPAAGRTTRPGRSPGWASRRRFLGRLSTDAAGRRLRAALAADGVDLDHVVATDDPTTTAVATHRCRRDARSYRFDLDGTSAAGLTWPVLAATGLDPAAIEVLHVGTLGLVLEPSGTTIEALVDAVRRHGARLARPQCPAVGDRRPDAYRARIARLAARADVVKVSTDDLRFLDPDGDVEAGLARLLAAGTGRSCS